MAMASLFLYLEKNKIL
nr:photosystem I subunit VIII [Citrus unshiu]UFK62459.1 photosystem I subunit VIII [Murraya exotica]WGG26942.1 photosystem I subunit VIII [Citrus unshiu]